DAQVLAFNPPSVQGVGNVGGFQFQVLDVDDQGFATDFGSTMYLLGAANSDPRLAGAFTAFRNDLPEFNLAIDRTKVEALHIPVGDVAQTLSTMMGSQYVNDFTMKDRSYRVYVEADDHFRSNLDGLSHMYVRSPANGLVPLSDVLSPTAAKTATEINH